MGSFRVVGTDKFGPIFRVEEIEMVIVPKVFISWLHMTTQNVYPGTLFTMICVMY